VVTNSRAYRQGTKNLATVEYTKIQISGKRRDKGTIQEKGEWKLGLERKRNSEQKERDREDILPTAVSFYGSDDTAKLDRCTVWHKHWWIT